MALSREITLFAIAMVVTTTTSRATMKGFRGNILHFVSDPFAAEHAGRCEPSQCDEEAAEYLVDGLLVVNERNGKVVAVGPYSALVPKFHLESVDVFPEDSLITPGFIDCHAHAPQIDMIGSFGDTLENWLMDFTFPSESQYIDPIFARKSAHRFFNQLVRSGTTSAVIFNAMFPQASDAVFSEALRRNVRVITGLTGMASCSLSVTVNFTDPGHEQKRPMCNSMDYEDVAGRRSAEQIEEQARELISKYHGRGRLLYALIPRFLTTSTPASLEVWKKLQNEFAASDIRFHTHIAENLDVSRDSVDAFKDQAKEFYGAHSNEFAEIQNLVTQIDVFNYYGLMTHRSSFAHGVHLTDSDYQIFRSTGASICHCPTSNLFLGSGKSVLSPTIIHMQTPQPWCPGFFNIKRAVQEQLPFGLGTDVGAGTTFSLLDVLGEVYKVALAGDASYANEPNSVEGHPFQENNKDPNNFIPFKSPYRLSPLRELYLATLGTAKQTRLDPWIGNFEPGKEADFVVLDMAPTPLLERRRRVLLERGNSPLHTIAEVYFGLTTVPSDRSVLKTFIAGNIAYDRALNYDLSLDEDYSVQSTASR